MLRFRCPSYLALPRCRYEPDQCVARSSVPREGRQFVFSVGLFFFIWFLLPRSRRGNGLCRLTFFRMQFYPQFGPPSMLSLFPCIVKANVGYCARLLTRRKQICRVDLAWLDKARTTRVLVAGIFEQLPPRNDHSADVISRYPTQEGFSWAVCQHRGAGSAWLLVVSRVSTRGKNLDAG